jgi:hypothetical protein
MVTGRVPFEGQTPLAVAIKQKSEIPPDARDTNPLVPEPLVRIIYRCLEKDPARRFQSAEELAAALGDLEQDLPSIVREISRSEARPPSGSKPATASPAAAAGTPRRRKAWIAAAMVFIALAVGLLLTRSPGHRSPDSPARNPDLPSYPLTVEVGRGHQPPGEATLRGFKLALPQLDKGDVRGALDKFIKSADPSDLDNVERVVGAVKGFLPDKGPTVDAYNKLRDEIRSRRSGTAASAAPPGPPAPGALKSAPEKSRQIQSDKQKLLAVVAEREAALKAKSDMETARDQARKSGADDRNLLFRLARYEEGNAAEAVAKNDFSGAKSLYTVLAKTYALAPGCSDEAACASALRRLVEGFKAEASGPHAAAVDPWLLAHAKETESQAQTFLTKREIDNAGGAFLRAAFLYEKIKEASAASAPIS